MMLGTKNLFMYFCRGDMLCLYFAERLGSLAEIKPWGVNLSPYSKWANSEDVYLCRGQPALQGKWDCRLKSSLTCALRVSPACGVQCAGFKVSLWKLPDSCTEKQRSFVLFHFVVSLFFCSFLLRVKDKEMFLLYISRHSLLDLFTDRLSLLSVEDFPWLLLHSIAGWMGRTRIL